LINWIYVSNVIFAVGSFIFSLALIPSIKSKDKPAIFTSLSTGAILTIYLICYAMLGMWLAFVAGIFVVVAWYTLAIQKMRKG
jgi:hypothetical protein